MSNGYILTRNTITTPSTTAARGEEVMPEKIKFFDLVAKKPFETDKYEIIIKETKRGKFKFARAKSPYTGKVFYKILGKA